MKPLLFVLFLVCLISGCSKSDSSGNAGMLPGKWKMVGVQNLATGTMIKKEADDVNRYCQNRAVCDVIMELKKDSMGLILDGHTITNDIGGNLVAQANGEMVVELVWSTQVGDARWSDYLLNNLGSVKAYEVSPVRLLLYFNNRNERLIFHRD